MTESVAGFDIFLERLRADLERIAAEGLHKRERPIGSAQGTRIMVEGRRVLNLCANNYLGLADHPALIAAAEDAMRTRGYGMASVRFICGTQDLHRRLEARLADFLGTVYGWLPRGKGFSVDAGVISVAAMYTASGLQHGGCAP